MAHYVITGATGHIGNNLVRMINETEPESTVTVLVRREKNPELEGTVCQAAVGNISDPEFLASVISAGDTVIHLAGKIDLTDRNADETWEVNFSVTKKICQISLERKAGRVIYVGSVDGIAREGIGDGEITEPAEYDPDAVEGNYGKSKAAAMKFFWGMILEHPEFPGAMVLPSAVIGINDRKPSAAGKVIRDTLMGKPQFGLRGGYDFVNVKDVCRAILTLSRNGLRDQFILSGYPISVRELYEFIDREKGWKKKPIILPDWLIGICMPFVPVLNPITVKALRDPHRYSCRHAEEAFGYVRTPLEETLRETVGWFEKEIQRKKKENP